MTGEDRPGPPSPGSAWPYDKESPAAAGHGLASEMQSPWSEVLHVGRVSDVYTNSFSCTVQIPRRTAGAGLRCIWIGTSINRWGGSAMFNPPEVGSEVLVYEVAGQDIGLILGQVPSRTTNPDPEKTPRLFPDGEVDSFGQDNAQIPEELGTTGQAMNAFQGMPMDALPGDWGVMSEYGAALACLRFMASLRASEMAKVEAFVLDDLVRITAMQREDFDAGGERRTYNDHGRVTTETAFTLSGREADGLIGDDSELDPFPGDEEGADAIRKALERQTGRWRAKLFQGHLGDLINLFVAVPRDKGDSLGKATLDEPEHEENRDLGLAQLHLDTDGRVNFRSVSGMGMIKPRAIAVPKKRHEAADPDGDTNPLRDKPADFTFKPDASPGQQVRDYLAYMAAKHTPANMLQQPLDWHMPDESTGESGCPQIDKESKGGDVEAGGHFRGTPTPIDGAEIDPAEFKGRIFYVNDAYVIVLPDGSVVIRDGWGSQVTMNRGHIDISASKDVNITAGRNVNVRAGNDLNLNARKSADVTAATGQARLHGGSDVHVNSKGGGILISTDGPGHKFDPEKLGEEQGFPGIVLKSGGEVVTSAAVARFDLSNYMHVRPQESDGPAPQLIGKFSRLVFDLDGGDAAFKFSDDHYVQLGGSNLYSMRASSSILVEGNVDAYLGNLTVQGIQAYDVQFNNVTAAEVSDGGAGTAPAPGKRWESIIDGLSPNYTGKKVSGAVSKGRRNTARARVELKADNSKVIGGTPFSWDSLVENLPADLLAQMSFSFRTAQDYGTKDLEDFAIFEAPWQREWSGTTGWGSGAENSENKTAEYPGWPYWNGDTKAFVRYEEGNVEGNGAAKARSAIKEDAGKVDKTGLRSMPRHP